MTKLSRKEILKKCIEKATRNGLPKKRTLMEHKDYGNGFHCCEKAMLCVIFSHDFAKAFFGEEDINMCLSCERMCGLNTDFSSECCDQTVQQSLSWIYHLQQLVISEDKLKYLSKFLDK